MMSYKAKRLKILITNDDGIHSPGLWAAVDALREMGEIFVMAPDREQSGLGSALTLHAPIRASEATTLLSNVDNKSGIKAYSVEGTPADCCVLALERLVGPVDLVVSGINMGSNLGADIIVSGTVGAALQSYVRGYSSIAISVAAVTGTRYDVATAFLKLAIKHLYANTLPRPLLLNINIPNEPLDKIQGVRVTHMGRRSYGEVVTEGQDGRRKYYWITRNKPILEDQHEGSDIWALKHNYISITPLHTHFTDTEQLHVVEDLFKDFATQFLGGVPTLGSRADSFGTD